MTDNLLARQTYRNLLKSTMDATSIRNALGDIGNRIGFGVNNNNLNLKNDPGQLIKPVAPAQAPGNRSENVPKQQQQPVQQIVQKPAPVLVHQQQTTTTTSSTSISMSVTTDSTMYTTALSEHTTKLTANNSCIMLDESTDEEPDDEDVEILDEEDEEAEVEAANEDTEIVDIDSGDADNPQLFTAYVRSIYKYLIELERKYRISPQFLAARTITPKMRAVLIDWLLQVHSKFRLLQETMYLCVYLIDAYLERVDVSKMQLQLVGVTALFLACKYEEMYVPAIEDLVYMTDNTYTSAEIRAMEINMLKTLEFGFGKPLALHFLRRFSKAGQADPKHHLLAKYLMELSLHDIEFASMDPSYLAASSLCLSFKLLNGTQWNKQMEHYTDYNQSSLIAGMAKLARLVLKTRELDYKYRAAYNKYASSKCMRISLAPELNSELIRELASTHVNS